uniref:Stc1 domain-containing protein n=1 Tax=Bionectria ochroleuca TaxID=29856 RepID=A0A0B7JNV8_BIOOC
MASMEMKCSVCCLTQPITSFSKAARKREEPICKRCTHWGMGVEPEVTPAALQTGHISGEEVRGEVWVEEYLNTRNESQDASQHATQVASRDAAETESQVESSAASTCGGVRLDVDGTTTEDTRSEVSELPSELASSHDCLNFRCQKHLLKVKAERGVYPRTNPSKGGPTIIIRIRGKWEQCQ